MTSPEGIAGVELVLEPAGHPAAREYQQALYRDGIPATSFESSDIRSEFETQDAFALEYLSSVPRVPPRELEREVLDVFGLIRPISEQWGLTTATVFALRSPDRTGTYDVFAFRRSAAGLWSHTSQSITRNKL